MQIRGRNIPVGIACSILFLALFFSALPNWFWVDLQKDDCYWGCPAANYEVEHSIDGNSSGFMWDRLIFDILFWILYFSLLGLGGRMLFRKIGLKIRPVFWLVGLWILTTLLYARLYRPDILINAETGGFLSCFESREKQVDMAMRFGDVETIKTLFQKYPALISERTITGKTPLREAAYWGQTEIVSLLLADKADVEARDMVEDTPLFGAATCGFTGAAKLLILSGANVNARNFTKETPLMTAAECGNYSVVLLLLANKADVNARDRDGSSPLHRAATGGYTSTVQLLIASKAEINIRDNQGETPLFHAAEVGREKTVKLLLANGADVSIPDKYGMTPVQLASANGYTNIVEILKRHGGPAPTNPPIHQSINPNSGHLGVTTSAVSSVTGPSRPDSSNGESFV